jgi:hypothetical protein
MATSKLSVLFVVYNLYHFIVSSSLYACGYVYEAATVRYAECQPGMHAR